MRINGQARVGGWHRHRGLQEAQECHICDWTEDIPWLKVQTLAQHPKGCGWTFRPRVGSLLWYSRLHEASKKAACETLVAPSLQQSLSGQGHCMPLAKVLQCYKGSSLCWHFEVARG